MLFLEEEELRKRRSKQLRLEAEKWNMIFLEEE